MRHDLAARNLTQRTAGLQICAVGQWLHVPHRDRFWHAVVRELERPRSGDGRIARTITAAFLTYWQPNT